MTVADTIVYYDGPVLLWGNVNGERWLVLHVGGNRYLCVSTEGINLKFVSLGTLFEGARFTIDVTDGWTCELEPIDNVPSEWIPGSGAYLENYQ